MYKLYHPKTIEYGFVVICPNANIGQIKTTVNSIKCNYQGSPCLCVLPETIHKDDLKEVGKLCKSTTGGDTITSLINAGMRSPPCSNWNFIVISGSWVRPNLNKKFAYFIETEKDILFPIVERKTNFVEGTLNGILIHKKAFKEIGEFSNDNPLDICKMMWAIEAIEKGHKFKAIIGGSVC